MPHCALWSESDWLFAVDSASTAALYHETGDMRASSELRQRERVLGVTADARRDLRIRYVPEVAEPTDPAIVTAMDLYRRAAAGGDDIT